MSRNHVPEDEKEVEAGAQAPGNAEDETGAIAPEGAKCAVARTEDSLGEADISSHTAGRSSAPIEETAAPSDLPPGKWYEDAIPGDENRDGSTHATNFPPRPPSLEGEDQSREFLRNKKDKQRASLAGKPLNQCGVFLQQRLLEVLPLRSKTTGGGSVSSTQFGERIYITMERLARFRDFALSEFQKMWSTFAPLTHPWKMLTGKNFLVYAPLTTVGMR